MGLKKLFIVFSFISLTAVCLSGCLEQNNKNSGPVIENVELESNDLVTLAYGKLTLYKEDDVVLRAKVDYRLKNIANRVLNLNVTVEFYDKNDTLVNVSETRWIENLRIGYTEAQVNSAVYDGENVSKVDHAKIVVVERT